MDIRILEPMSVDERIAYIQRQARRKGKICICWFSFIWFWWIEVALGIAVCTKCGHVSYD